MNSILANSVRFQIEAITDKLRKMSVFDPRYNNLIRRRNELRIALRQVENPAHKGKETVHINKAI